MAFLPTNAAQVQQFAAALYGIQVGSGTMAQVTADITAAGGLNNALNAYYNVSFGSKTTASVAASVAANLGLTGQAATDGAAYVKAQLDAAPATARGAVVSNILNLFSTLATDATYGAAATAWNTKVAAAVSYTGAADVVAGSTVATGNAFVFTDKLDALNGSSGNDTFTGDASTITTADSVNGGEGTDTVIVYTAADITDVPTMTSVETLKLVDAAAASFALSSVGVSTIELKNPTTMDLAGATAFTTGSAAVVISDMSSAEGIRVNTSTKTNSTLNVTFDKNAGAAADTAITFDVEGSVDAVRTLAVTSTGSASKVALGTSTAHGITAVTVAGAANLSFDATNETTIVGFNASTATGNVTITQTAATADITFTGGTGNDKFNIGANLSTTDVLNGGAGNDTIAISDSTFTAASDAIVKALAAQTNFEVLELTAATSTGAYSLNKVAFDNFKFSGAIDAALVLNDANSEAITFSTTSAITSAATGSSDVTPTAGADLIDINPTLDNGSNAITLTIDGATLTGQRGGYAGATQTGGTGGDAFDVSPYETITLISTGTDVTEANVIQGGDGGSAATTAGVAGDALVLGTNVTVTISGANDLTIESVKGQNTTVNAAALTGKLVINMNDQTVDSNDTIIGGTNDDVIAGGDGVDTIDLSAGGSDTVRLDVQTRSATVGAATAKIVSAVDRDVIKGFTAGAGTGADKLDLAQGSADYQTAITGTTASVTVGTSKIYEFAFETTNNSADLSLSVTGSELGKGLISGATATTFTVGANDTGYIIAYDNGNAYLYYYVDGGDTTLTLATEVKLIAVLEGVAVGALVSTNIVA